MTYTYYKTKFGMNKLYFSDSVALFRGGACSLLEINYDTEFMNLLYIYMGISITLLCIIYIYINITPSLIQRVEPNLPLKRLKYINKGVLN